MVNIQLYTFYNKKDFRENRHKQEAYSSGNYLL